jgi:GDSL-like Lipase/Acylhydrolase family
MYGSSITQCRTAASPSRTWPALLARELDLDLTCLGFGAQRHLDPLIAREIGGTSPDVITTCVGINIYGQGTVNARSFVPAILGFIATIRDTCPDVPMLVISPIAFPEPGGDSGWRKPDPGADARACRRGRAPAALPR